MPRRDLRITAEEGGRAEVGRGGAGRKEGGLKNIIRITLKLYAFLLFRLP